MSGADAGETPARAPGTAGLAADAREAIDRLSAVVPDFPSPGILFRDLTPVFSDARAFRTVVDAVSAPFAGSFDAVAGVEARGFLLAAAVAYATGTGVVTVRKAGKLPRAVYRESYDLEYGQAALEIHQSDLPAGARVLVLDDVLATGGTLVAACALLEKAGAVVVGCGVVLELGDLDGRTSLAGRTVHALETV
ncbi:adenine phosphoribosyltransferase [Arthrobacter sp. MDT1-48-3]|uniref:Adenine phosphoribosyltransferase n=1 Tax=Arthrobacter agilis TaxID=37921 RepID=A0A2L0UCM1_9MICC|nr:adenine phosphoribosyltransferase [Arthrobacter agilis]AUZ86967.1 adenine phosphoribosyltransferase [Arthrobacter agilis]